MTEFLLSCSSITKRKTLTSWRIENYITGAECLEALTECLEALLITSHGNRTVEYAGFDLSHVSKTKAIHARDPVLVNLNISPFTFALKRLLRLLAVNLTGIKVYA